MREKLIELLCQATFGVNKQTIPSYLPSSAIAEVADHLIANGVTFATDNNVGHWITKNGCTFCSECMTCGSPQWKVCPVCETRMVGDELSPTADKLSATEPKWIPVTDRLPEESDYYLAMSDGQCLLVPYSTKHKAFNAFDTTVNPSRYQIAATHWMPLPTPPKGE